MREHIKFYIGRNLIGSAILSREISFSTFSYAATEYCITDFNFVVSNGNLGPV